MSGSRSSAPKPRQPSASARGRSLGGSQRSRRHGASSLNVRGDDRLPHPTRLSVAPVRRSRMAPAHDDHVTAGAELRSAKLRYTLFAADGSTITLHAPVRPDHATAPPISAKPEAGGRHLRTVKLDVVGPEQAGSGVEVEIESNLATYLPQTWIGGTTLSLIGGNSHLARCDPRRRPALVRRFFKWLCRGKGDTRTERSCAARPARPPR